MKKEEHKLTLDRLVTYRIVVPGTLEVNWLDWDGGMVVRHESDCKGDPITSLTITLDQAGLQGLLRYLYSLGLPMIAVVWVDFKGNLSEP